VLWWLLLSNIDIPDPELAFATIMSRPHVPLPLLLFLFTMIVNALLVSTASAFNHRAASKKAIRVLNVDGLRMISSGFSFEDGEQVLVSVQKPLGLVLEQDEGPIIVTGVDPSGSAGQAGVKPGDVLLAVQNASVENVDLDSVLGFIQNGPRVMNLRLLRAPA